MQSSVDTSMKKCIQDNDIHTQTHAFKPIRMKRTENLNSNNIPSNCQYKRNKRLCLIENYHTIAACPSLITESKFILYEVSASIKCLVVYCVRVFILIYKVYTNMFSVWLGRETRNRGNCILVFRDCICCHLIVCNICNMHFDGIPCCRCSFIRYAVVLHILTNQPTLPCKLCNEPSELIRVREKEKVKLSETRTESIK